MGPKYKVPVLFISQLGPCHCQRRPHAHQRRRPAPTSHPPTQSTHPQLNLSARPLAPTQTAYTPHTHAADGTRWCPPGPARHACAAAPVPLAARIPITARCRLAALAALAALAVPEGQGCSGLRSARQHARCLPPLHPVNSCLPPHWVAGYPPSLPLRQVALHEAALQHCGLAEEQVPPVLEEDIVARLVRG